jgi:hypothetical protein
MHGRKNITAPLFLQIKPPFGHQYRRVMAMKRLWDAGKY